MSTSPQSLQKGGVAHGKRPPGLVSYPKSHYSYLKTLAKKFRSENFVFEKDLFRRSILTSVNEELRKCLVNADGTVLYSSSSNRPAVSTAPAEASSTTPLPIQPRSSPARSPKFLMSKMQSALPNHRPQMPTSPFSFADGVKARRGRCFR